MMGSLSTGSCVPSLLMKHNQLGRLVWNWKSTECNVSTVPVSVNWDTSAFGFFFLNWFIFN